MEETKGFFELAQESGGQVKPFEPTYTEEFRKYMEESVRSSANRHEEAVRDSYSIVINC
jgi:hypothetical protein